MESFRYEIDNGHLKEFSYEEFQDLTIISNGSSEITNLKKIDSNTNNENVIRVYGVTEDPSNKFYSIVLTYCYNTNLREHLKKEETLRGGWEYKVKMAMDIAKGLKYIHTANIVHCDLNSNNIMNHDGKLMIIDFSSSISLDSKTKSTLKITDENAAYVDARCFDNHEYDKYSDIYSLGVILWEISSCKIPFSNKSEADIKKLTLAGRRETPVNSTPIDYKELYCYSWNDDFKKRPTIEKVIKCLEEIEFDIVYQDSDYVSEISCGTKNNLATKKDACLTVIQGSPQNQYFFLPLGKTDIGRSSLNDIIIKDQEIAKKHAYIDSYQGTIKIFDLGSESGIFVNGERLMFRTSRTLIRDDKIKMGRSVFQYLPTGEYENRIDKLLPIYNKDYLLKSLKKEFNNAKENKQDLSLIFFDLDHFKKINDTHSHDAGDYVLKELAKLVQTLIRPEDIFARYGGEEFTIQLKNENSVQAFKSAEKIRKSVESHHFIYNGIRLLVTISSGVAEMDSSMEDYEDLLKHADQASYVAKSQGRNKVVIWTKKIDTDDIKTHKQTTQNDNLSSETDRQSVLNDTNYKQTTQNDKLPSVTDELSVSNDYLEIFSGPLDFPTHKKTIQHDKLPSVTNELSVVLELNLDKHNSENWTPIFHKGQDTHTLSPTLWLTPNESEAYPMCSMDDNTKNIIVSGIKFELNKWYHIAYTLSELQGRMEFYVNGKLVGFETNEETRHIVFNTFPLKIGHSDGYTDFQGQMSNFRYYNVCLSSDEIAKDYRNKGLGSK
ncbi:hypothetical protein C2G38_2140995 [Gigaspora rosea]|uniref:Kinase-like domain-containing protein n=1 Tax=Gigaspora rosea TaxID=44941 RepID=A0A397VNL6_9GLOM|nr:hypothetical protein C2G38_2140995 [Gigaspora rosea]